MIDLHVLEVGRRVDLGILLLRAERHVDGELRGAGAAVHREAVGQARPVIEAEQRIDPVDRQVGGGEARSGRQGMAVEIDEAVAEPQACPDELIRIERIAGRNWISVGHSTDRLQQVELGAVVVRGIGCGLRREPDRTDDVAGGAVDYGPVGPALRRHEARRLAVDQVEQPIEAALIFRVVLARPVRPGDLHADEARRDGRLRRLHGRRPQREHRRSRVGLVGDPQGVEIGRDRVAGIGEAGHRKGEPCHAARVEHGGRRRRGELEVEIVAARIGEPAGHQSAEEGQARVDGGGRRARGQRVRHQLRDARRIGLGRDVALEQENLGRRLRRIDGDEGRRLRSAAVRLVGVVDRLVGVDAVDDLEGAKVRRAVARLVDRLQLLEPVAAHRDECVDVGQEGAGCRLVRDLLHPEVDARAPAPGGGRHGGGTAVALLEIERELRRRAGPGRERARQ